MKSVLLITSIMMLLIIPSSTIYAVTEQEDKVDPTLKKLSDHINSNWVLLLVIGILCIFPGMFLVFPVYIGVIIFVVLALNALFLSPITH